MTLMSNPIKVYLPKVVGKGYKKFWYFKGRYRIVKGSRSSKKSKTAALWYIANLIKYPEANLLVVRKVYRTLINSCFKELKWAAQRLKVKEWFDFKVSPLEITYKPTGQKIYFYGLDDPIKITSIAVEHGVLCWLWIEEGYEIMREDDFDMIDEAIRGLAEGNLFKQVTITFNPWNEKHWLKKRFFDVTDDDILAMTTDYRCNEWLDESDKKLFENMKKNNPRRYNVAGLGNWGIVEGLIYENWEEKRFTLDEVINCKTAFGLDFGYSIDEAAFIVAYIDLKENVIYIYDELYEKGLSNRMLFERILEMGYSKEKITADSAEPKSIDELRTLGLRRIKAAKKGPDSINHGIQFIQNFEIIVHPRCVNFITEISNYTWDQDKFGKTINRPVDDFNHLLDALRYGCEEYSKGNTWLF